MKDSVKKLHFDYYMQIRYSVPVSTCHFTIKCLPQDTLRQKVENLAIEVYPDVKYSQGNDSFGNRQFYGSVIVPHDTFHYRVCGDVVTYAVTDRPGNSGEFTDGGYGMEDAESVQPVLPEEEADENMISVYKYPHGLNVPGERLKAYHAGMKLDAADSACEKGMCLMHRLYQDFIYEKESTGMATTAEEAFCQGKGVCQDYAHILIALLHLEGIPARYAAGMMVGEGASHAWVELYQDGKWYGLDPTNDKVIGQEYIRINVGRDAGDCLINRGTMRGGGDQTQTIQVIVKEREMGI